jgi:hypothetical protein
MAVRPLQVEIRGDDKTGRAFDAVQRRAGRLNRAFGSLGNLAKAIGPAGLVSSLAGAGGLVAALNQTTAAMEEFDLISKRARQFGLDSDFYQTLSFSAGEASISQASLNSALLTFTRRVGLARAETGAMEETLKKLNPQLLEQFKATRSQEEAWSVLVNAIEDADSATEKASIAYAALGRSGQEVVRFLEQGADGFADAARRARQLGVIVDRDLLKKSEELQNQFGNLSLVVDRQLKKAFIDLGPALVSTLELFGKFAAGINNITQSMRAFDDASTSFLKERLGDLLELRATSNSLDRLGVADMVNKEIDEIQQVLTNRRVLRELEEFIRLGEGLPPAPSELVDPQNFTLPNVQIDEAASKTKNLAKELDTAATKSNVLAESMFDGFLSVVQGAATAEEAVKRLTSQLIEAALRAAFLNQGPFAQKGGGAGILGNLFGRFGSGGAPGAPLNLLPGNARGGMFSVPTGGATDSRIVVARADPGEQMAFIPRGRGGGGGGNQVVNVFNAPAGTQTRQRQDNGSRITDIILPMVDRHISSGGADGALQRFGARPRVTLKG